MTRSPCTVPGCPRPMHGRGLCTTHTSRLQRTGTIDPPKSRSQQGCTVPDCDGQHYSRGLCSTHYRRQLRTGGTALKAPAGKPSCSVDDCGRGPYARGLCRMHYRRLLRTGTTGDPTPGTRRKAPTPTPQNPKLPPGWFNTRPPTKSPQGLGGPMYERDVPPIVPLTEAVVAAAVETLRRHGALDLAPMLGLEGA